MNQNKIAFVLPFVNSLPRYSALFFRSVELNPCIDILLIVDRIPPYSVPSNVHVIITSKQDIISRIRSHTGLEIKEITGHKLCDFRPLFPLIFEDYISNYEWWGHCDIDLMFGNLEAWMYQYLDSSYDVISASESSTIGHFTIWKNSHSVTSQIAQMLHVPKYRQKFISPNNQHLDEGGAYEFLVSSTSLRILNTPRLEECLQMKLCPYGITFNPDGTTAGLDYKEYGLAYWKDGHTWYESANRKPVEVLYVHFMGNKSWWNMIFYRIKLSARSFHPFSPLGYGLVTDVTDLNTYAYKSVRFVQCFLSAVKVKSGVLLRSCLGPDLFRVTRRILIRSGRYS
jgi:hypothetical protein